MGQLLLPLFPRDIQLITPTLGVQIKDDTVYYYHSGVPIYSHGQEEYNKFRYCTSNFVLQGLCKGVDIAKTFHVSIDSVRGNKKRLESQGEDYFFNTEPRKRRSHKLTPSLLALLQEKLDTSQSVNSIAKEHGISEGSIRYAIQQGRLKKKKS